MKHLKIVLPSKEYYVLEFIPKLSKTLETLLEILLYKNAINLTQRNKVQKCAMHSLAYLAVFLKNTLFAQDFLEI